MNLNLYHTCLIFKHVHLWHLSKISVISERSLIKYKKPKMLVRIILFNVIIMHPIITGKC